MEEKRLLKHVQNILDNEELNQLIASTEVSINFVKAIREEGFELYQLPVRYVSLKALEGLSNYYNVEIESLGFDTNHITFSRNGVVITFLNIK